LLCNFTKKIISNRNCSLSRRKSRQRALQKHKEMEIKLKFKHYWYNFYPSRFSFPTISLQIDKLDMKLNLHINAMRTHSHTAVPSLSSSMDHENPIFISFLLWNMLHNISTLLPRTYDDIKKNIISNLIPLRVCISWGKKMKFLFSERKK
jgi:hypothetical protein